MGYANIWLMGKKIVKVNLASGPASTNSWINFDSGLLPLLSKFPALRRLLLRLGLLSEFYNEDWPKIRLVDISRELPLSDNSVDFVYCSQALEHFEYWQTENILGEMYRILKPGGIVRVSVPDIDKMVQLYLEENKDNPSDAARNLNLLWWGHEKDVKPENFLIKLSHHFIRPHQWQYNKASMEELLKKVDFRKITLRSFRRGRVPGLKGVELEIHRDHSLFLEAQKSNVQQKQQ